MLHKGNLIKGLVLVSVSFTFLSGCFFGPKYKLECTYGGAVDAKVIIEASNDEIKEVEFKGDDADDIPSKETLKGAVKDEWDSLKDHYEMEEYLKEFKLGFENSGTGNSCSFE